MNKDEILAKLAELNTIGETRSLTDEEYASAKSLEADLQRAKDTEEFRARHQAYVTPVNQAAVNLGTTKTDDGLERAFEAYLRTGKENADIVELRAQLTSSNAGGGYTVPTTWLPRIVDRVKVFGGAANVAEVITTATGEPVRFPTIDDTANQGAIATEGSPSSGAGADLVFGQKTLGAYSYDALGASDLPIKVSQELLADTAYDLEGKLIDKMSQRIGRKQASDFVKGTGSGQPAGLVTNTTTTFSFDTTTGTQAIGYTDLLNAVHSIDIGYRDGAVWLFNDYTLSLIEGIVDGNGRPLLNNAMDGINVGRSNQMLLGYPVQVDNAWANFSDPSTNLFGAFGNIREGYLIRRVQDVTVFANPYSSAASREVEFNMWARCDAVVQNPYAFAVLKNVTP